LLGGEGDDRLDGGEGLDVMAGGAGDDIYYVDGFSEIIPPPDEGSDGTDPGDEPDAPNQGGKGNQGVGNGEDPPPPGQDHNFNDGPGTSPGNPGSRGGFRKGGFGNKGHLPWKTNPWKGNPWKSKHPVKPLDESPEDIGDFGVDLESAPGPQIVWHTDEVHENANSGHDRVFSRATFELPDYVEELHLVGEQSIDGAGNSGDNLLFGNSADNRLDGRAGDDRMSGGLGDDTFVVDSAGDQVVEAAGEGTDTVESHIDYQLGEYLENLTLLGDADLEGKGNSLDNKLVGGAGNNLLAGGAGDDTYHFRLGQGLNEIQDEQGTNRVTFGEHISRDNVVARISRLDGQDRVQVFMVDRHGNELDDQGFVFNLDEDGQAPVATFGFASGEELSLEELLVKQDTHSGHFWPNRIHKKAHTDDSIDVGGGNDRVRAGAGHDRVYGGRGRDSLFGEAGHDLLFGEQDRDQLHGGFGRDQLYGGDGRDTLFGSVGNDLLAGGSDGDHLNGGYGSDVLLGGEGDDHLVVGPGSDLVLFNRGDDKDSVRMKAGLEAFTVSLGGGVDLSALSFERLDDDLVLSLGESRGKGRWGRWGFRDTDQLRIRDWYDRAPGELPQVTLQVIMPGTAGYEENSGGDLFAHDIQGFDLNKLVERFNASGQNRWRLMDSLLDAHLEGSDSEALGGDIAYQYGLGRDPSELDPALTLSNLSDPKLGKAPQMFSSDRV